MAYVAPSITASGTTFAQLQAGGASAHLEKLIAAQVATAAPTVAATATATGGGSTGGLLAAGTYYFVVTETNGIGETTAGPVSAQLTVGATNIPQITFATLKTGNTARNIYLGLPSGASTGPFYLYATGITAATYNMAVAAPAGSYGLAQPPTATTTGLSFTNALGVTENITLSLIRSAKDGSFEQLYRYYARVISDFDQGEPLPFSSAIEKLHHAHVAFAILNTMATEAGVLIDANPGHFTPTATPIGTTANRRFWP